MRRGGGLISKGLHACNTLATSERPASDFLGTCTLCILLIFVTLRLVCPISMPAALRHPQKKQPLELWNMYLAHLVDFCYCEVGVPNQRACSVLATSEKVRHCIFCPTCSGGSSLLVRHFAAAACSALKQSQAQIPPVDKGVPDCNEEWRGLISKGLH